MNKGKIRNYRENQENMTDSSIFMTNVKSYRIMFIKKKASNKIIFVFKFMDKLQYMNWR